VEGIGPQLDRWDEQLSELDPSATEQLPARQPQPRMDKIYFDCLKTAEGAVRNHTILRFKYRRSRDGVESRRAIAPYELFDYTGRIYVWGPEEGAHHPKFFAIDRMTEAASKEGDVFKPDAELRLDNWLKHSFGIYISGDGSTRPAEKRNVLRIVVRFARNRAADVNARRWPAEVKRKNLADGSVEMIFEVDDPREIVAWVLSFGGDAKITAPPEAAEMARHFADAILTDHKWAERVPVDERLLRFDWVAD